MRLKYLVCAHLVIATAALAACKGSDPRPVQEAEQASASVTGGEGCTLTQGYWKNHEEAWPVTSLTIGGVSYDADELLDLFRTPPKGDASLILGHQLVAALLNVASGAVAPQDVADALSDAEAWMASHADADGRLPYKVKGGAAAAEAKALADTLAHFNEGTLGPGHCDDGPGGSTGTTGAGGAGGAGGCTSVGAGGAGGSDSTSAGAGGAGGGTGNEDCPSACDPLSTEPMCAADEVCIDGCCFPVPSLQPVH
jgi:hypothetical protein